MIRADIKLKPKAVCHDRSTIIADLKIVDVQSRSNLNFMKEVLEPPLRADAPSNEAPMHIQCGYQLTRSSF